MKSPGEGYLSLAARCSGAAAALLTAIPLSFFTAAPERESHWTGAGHAHPATPSDQVWYGTTEFLAAGVIILFLTLNVIFW